MNLLKALPPHPFTPWSVPLLGALLVGCTDPLTMGGGVRVAEPCVPHLEPGADPPVIAGATVTVRCPPSGATVLEVVTDERGRFLVTPQAPFAFECEVSVGKSGYLTRTYAMRDVCAYVSSPPTPFWKPTPPEACYGVSVPARLFPAPGAREVAQ